MSPESSSTGEPAGRGRSRRLAFAGLLACLLLVGGGYVALAALRDDSPTSDPVSLASTAKEPHLVFQDTRNEAEAHVSLAPLDKPNGRRVTTSLVCTRIHFAAERGLCLAPKVGPFKNAYHARIIDNDFKIDHAVELSGSPSRARVSPDGRYGATTSFVTGHSYAEDVFSTQTLIIDMGRGKVLANLEKDFTVIKDGKPIKEVDFNFWGVTFAKDSNRFYATLRTGDRTYLLEGDVRARRARVLRENVECPSISPDNTRLAYKKLIKDTWHFYVLDLKSGVETALASTNGIDDQVEWLDNQHVLYGFSPPAAIWVIPADGSGSPRKFISEGLSPAVVRN
jgi:dipeptidyl aminopeptidase/acylaminoacyl peptidase